MLAKKITRYKLIFVLVVIAFLAFYIYLAFEFKPEPISDFLEYWGSIVDPSRYPYLKGGIITILYFPFKSIPPYVAATFINTAFYIVLSRLFYIRNSSRKKQIVSILIFVCVSFWLAGMIPLVNTDIPHVVLLTFAIRLIYQKYYHTKKQQFILLVIIAGAVSLRFQAIIPLSGICLIILFKKQFWKTKYFNLFITVIIGVVVGFLIHTIQIQPGNNQGNLKLRGTIYHGLFTSQTYGTCGEYTKEGADIIISEADKPFFDVISSNLQKRSAFELLSVALCKADRMVGYNQFSFYWLYASSHKETQLIYMLNLLEPIFANVAKLFAIFFIFTPVFNSRWVINKKSYYKMLLLMVLIYFIFHLIVEIQARYMFTVDVLILTSLFPIFLKNEHGIIDK